MELFIEDFNEYTGYLYLTSEDQDIEFAADVDDAYDYNTGEWDEEAFRASADSQVKAFFGDDAVIVWGD